MSQVPSYSSRVRVNPGTAAPRARRARARPARRPLGLLHELFRPALVAQVQLDGGEAIIAGKQPLRLVGLLGEYPALPGGARSCGWDRRDTGRSARAS